MMQQSAGTFKMDWEAMFADMIRRASRRVAVVLAITGAGVVLAWLFLVAFGGGGWSGQAADVVLAYLLAVFLATGGGALWFSLTLRAQRTSAA